jgi:hypothetical protein
MKLLFAAIAAATAQQGPPRTAKGDENKGANDGSCTNNGNCYLAGRNDSFHQEGPNGGCYCDAACYTQFNDCCHDMQYQCYNGEDLCPSTKCYTQNTQWVSGDTDIQCAMTNSACLENTCSMSGMVVKLDVELFHTNGQDAAAFVDQLTNGTRDLSMNGTPLANGSWSASGNTITVKVNYADDNVTPTMSEKNGKNFINYGVQFASNGNAPGFETIEFYVDTKIEAECEYPADVMVEADGFWVNQEDVEMAMANNGDLAANFDCRFYADNDRNDQIMSHNIVNMGEMLYGVVDADELHGLGFKLTAVEVSDPQNAANVYDVTANAATVNYSVDPSDAMAATGEHVNFEYLSFGFETYGSPNGNQNEINVKCMVELYVL